MQFLFVSQLFGERIIQALCWTLVHSLWQGLLLTILTGGLILVTRRSGAVIRYGLFSGVFLLFIVGACFTFAWQWDRGAAHAPAALTPVTLANASPAPLYVNGGAGDVVTAMPVYREFTDRLVNYFNEHASVIVTIWFIIFSARLVKILANLGTMQRIRHYRIHAPSTHWKERLQELAGLLHIRQPVDLMESELIKVPMMAGIFKPVILLPFSLMSQLPAEQVEAILLHELAHIRRRDYFVNLVQSFAEILFFFNPGVLWVCSLIREERENCCDDIAVGATGNKKELIRALVSFQEYNNSIHKYSIAFRGSGNHLLQRVKRILYHDNKIMDMREKFFLLCSLLVTAGLLLAFSGAPRPKKHTPGIAPALPAAHSPALPPTLSDAVTKSVVKNDTVPPVARVEQFEEQKDSIPENPDTVAPARPRSPVSPISPVKRKTSAAQVTPDKPLAPKKPTIIPDGDAGDGSAENLKEEQRQLIEELHGMQEKASQLQEEMEKRLEQVLKNSGKEPDQNYKMQQKAIEKQRKLLSDEQLKLADAERDLSREAVKLEEQERMLAMDKAGGFQDGEGFKTARGFTDSAKFKAFRSQNRWPAKPLENMNQKFIAPIVADLFEAKLITRTDEFSFSLNAESLIVNGEAVRDEGVFQRFKAKYIKDARNELKYSRKKNGSESITVNVY